MAKLDRRLAYYQDGRVEEGKTTRKSFDENGLIGVVSLFDDGTREKENLGGVEPTETKGKIAKLRFEKSLEFKHDGGDTPEIKALKKELEGSS